MTSVDTPGLTTDIASLEQSVGRKLGPTEWAEMTQERVNEFADLTGDHNFIHVDPERASQTPFGGTIAHGYLSLSLLAPVNQLLTVSDAVTSINYGLNKLRFPGPLRVGARYRGFAEITSVSEIKGGKEAQLTATLEVENAERPAVVAETIVRFYA
jgi:acyl dehydratase